MFVCGTGSMRGPRAKTPLLLLLLLLLLLTALTGTGFCEDYGADPDAETDAGADPDAGAGADAETETQEEEAVDPEPEDGNDPTEIPDIFSTVPGATGVPDYTDVENTIEDDHGSGLSRSLPVDVFATSSESTVDPVLTDPTAEPVQVDIIFILIPVVLVVLVLVMIVCCVFICRRWKRNEAMKKEDPYLDGSSIEKVPMPMFEEDVPSVLELEMEELGQWMKKDGEPAEDTVHA